MLYSWWQQGYFRAPSNYRAQAWVHRYDDHDGIHHAQDHHQIPRLSVSICGPLAGGVPRCLVATSRFLSWEVRRYSPTAVQHGHHRGQAGRALLEGTAMVRPGCCPAIYSSITVAAGHHEGRSDELGELCSLPRSRLHQTRRLSAETANGDADYDSASLLLHRPLGRAWPATGGCEVGWLAGWLVWSVGCQSSCRLVP